MTERTAHEEVAVDEVPASTRPRVAVPAQIRHLEPMAVAVLLLALVTLQFEPIWSALDTSILGDAETDAIKGMWSFDHVRRSMIPPETPIWSNQANYPEGVLALVLPWVSAVVLSPLGGAFGPIMGWNLSVIAMVWALGMTTAWLVRVCTESWAAGAVAGAAMLSQPMLIHAIGDGTPEHLSLWTVPLFLVAAWKALSRNIPAWAVAAGLCATVVALDSPYNAIYTAVISMWVLPFALVRKREASWLRQLAWTLGLFVLSVAIGALLIWLLYRNFPLDESTQQVSLQSTAEQSCQLEVASHESRGQVCLDLYYQPANFSNSCRDEISKFCSMNTTDLRTWWQFDIDNTQPRESSLAPTVISRIVLLPLLLLSLVGAPRALPWLFSGLMMTGLSLDLNTVNPQRMEIWLGSQGLVLGEQLLALNAWLNGLPGINQIRFPQRWLLPAALCLLVSGSHGLARIYSWLKKPPLASLLQPRLPRVTTWISRTPPMVPKGLILLSATWLAFEAHDSGLATSRIRNGFPMQELPSLEFAEWVRDQPGEGAFVLLPETRPAPKTGRGPMQEDLPVFAEIDKTLSGSDKVFLQVLMNRPSLHYPGLKTLRTMNIPDDKYRIMRNWDDLCHPKLDSSNPIPSSVYDPRHTADRQRIITELRKAGLRFVIIDRSLYEGEALEILTTQLEQHTIGIHEFEDGDGVTVFELGER